jgi:hypothetical protein
VHAIGINKRKSFDNMKDLIILILVKVMFTYIYSKFCNKKMKYPKIILLSMIMFSQLYGIYADDTWTSYTNSNNIYSTTFIGWYLWARTNGGVVRWDIRNMSYEKYFDGRVTITSIPMQ